MIEIGKDLFQFASKKDGKTYYAYLWKRTQGNLLFNHIPQLAFWKAHLGKIESLGGIKWAYLTHAGDADEGTMLLHKTFGTQLAGEEYEGQKARKKCKVPLGKLITSNEAPEVGLECIHAPGHCPTFLAFRIAGPKASYIYTSDMFFQSSEQIWKVTVPERMARIGLKSLESIFAKPFGYLLPGLSGEGVAGPIKMGGAARMRLMETLQAVLRNKYRMPDMRKVDVIKPDSRRKKR